MRRRSLNCRASLRSQFGVVGCTEARWREKTTKLPWAYSRPEGPVVFEKLAPDVEQIQRRKLRFGYDGTLNVFRPRFSSLESARYIECKRWCFDGRTCVGSLGDVRTFLGSHLRASISKGANSGSATNGGLWRSRNSSSVHNGFA